MISNSNYSTIPAPGKVILYLELDEIPCEAWESVFRITCLEGFVPQIRISGSTRYTLLVGVLYEGRETPEIVEAFQRLNSLLGQYGVLILARK